MEKVHIVQLLYKGDSSDANDRYFDFNVEFALNAKDSLTNGLLCGTAGISVAVGGNSSLKTMHVRNSLVLVMSSNDIRTSFTPAAVCTASESVKTVLVTFADFHNQPPPSGTTIKFTTTNGSIVAGGNVTIPSTNHNGGLTYAVSIKGNTDATASGNLIAEVTTPSGVIQSFTFATVTDISCTP